MWAGFVYLSLLKHSILISVLSLVSLADDCQKIPVEIIIAVCILAAVVIVVVIIGYCCWRRQKIQSLDVTVEKPSK